MTNQEMIESLENVMTGVGVVKSLTPTVQTTESMQAGQFMNRAQVEQLVDLTVSQSGWLGAVSVKIRNARSGEMPRITLSDIVTEGVPENGMKTIATHPDTDTVSYDCRKYQSTYYMTYEELREARASGEPNVEAKIMAAFAKAMGNDMARASLNGDTSLDTSSRLNRLLRQRDGWFKKLRAAANVIQTTRGSDWAISAFYAAIAEMPEIYREDPDIRWLMPSLLDLKWTETIAAYAAGGSALGDRLSTERSRTAPTGISQLLVPQIATDGGFSITSTGAAPDVAETVTDDGDGTISLQIDDLFGGYAIGHAGRYVRVTYSGTGQSEVCQVKAESSHLVIHTVGALGQGTISTTAASYPLDLADLTSLILTNPKNLFVVLCDNVRAYRKWEQEGERWRIDCYYEADYGVFNTDAAVVVDGIIRPSFSWGS